MSTSTVVVNPVLTDQLDVSGTPITQDLVLVEYVVNPVPSGTTYHLLVDLDNPDSVYPHTETGYFHVAAVFGKATKSKTNDALFARAGVILAIDGTQATIGYFGEADLFNDGSTTLSVSKTTIYYPLIVDLQPDGAGGLVKIASNNLDITTDVNTGVTLDDIAGNAKTPAAGDLVIRTVRTGSGTSIVDYGIGYRTVAL